MPFPGLLITALLAQADPGPVTSTQPATTQQTYEQEFAEGKKQTEEEYAQLPRHDPLPIKKILNIAIEEGHLHVRPLLGTTEGALRVEAPDWPGLLQVTVGDPASIVFFLKHVKMTDPSVPETFTHVITSPDNLQLNRDTEDATGVQSITLIQSRRLADEDTDFPIRVTVRKTFNDSDAPGTDIKIAGESFADLVQQHPREMRLYVLPILNDLGASDLFNTSTPALAWQVLGDEIAIDPKLDAKLKDITARLNVDDFKSRVAAEDELATLGPEAAAALRRQDLSKLPPDPATALRLFRQKWEPVKPEKAKVLTKDVQFLIDTLLLQDPRLRYAAAVKLQAAMGTSIDLPDDLSAEERAKRVEQLRDRFAPVTQPAG